MAQMLPRTGGAQSVDSTIARHRAASLRLSMPAAMSPSDLVGWLGAMQSQDYGLAKWSVAQRLAIRHPDVERAVDDGSILRTHALRPTWHFVARDDLRWIQMLTSPRVLALLRHYDRRGGLDAALIARSTRIIAAAIERQGHLTRPAIAAALAVAGIGTSAWLVGHLLMHAELCAVVCSGVPHERRQTYALVDERAPRRSAVTRDEALAMLASRYFQSHGPATARDYQWWSGLSAEDVARGIALLGRRVERMCVGDRTYLVSADRPRLRSKPRIAQVIQPYDELVVGYSESRAIVDARGTARRGSSGGAALLTRLIVCDGQIAARWRLRAGDHSSGIVVQPLRRLTDRERAAVTEATTRFERFHDRGRSSASHARHASFVTRTSPASS